MKNCPNCGASINDDIVFCPNCGAKCDGAPAAAPAQPQYAPQQPYAAPVMYVDPADHTAEFDVKDISDNKVIAMAPYVLSWLGIIAALLMAKSPFVSFHVRQVLKLEIVSTLLGIIAAVLCWTFIVPIAAGVCVIILFVLRIIGFFNVCGGKAKELPIIKSLGFLK